MFRMWSAGVGFRVNRLYAHQSHQTPDPFAVDPTALPAEMSRHRPAAVGRCFQVLLVDEAQDVEILSDALFATNSKPLFLKVVALHFSPFEIWSIQRGLESKIVFYLQLADLPVKLVGLSFSLLA